MKESTRTMLFVVVAVASVGLASVAHFRNQPKPLTGFEKVGTEFYPDFTDPNEALALRVVTYSEETASLNEFKVEFKDGAWRIPSHHYYPADAEDRLAETAASVIKIKRGALVSRRSGDYERYGVIDPLVEDLTLLKGRGHRVTLTGAGEMVLADYIIGKEVEDREDHYYVRSPGEQETYVTELKIDLSTKFADWIESDLLKLNSSDLAEVIVKKYSVDETRLQLVDQEENKLTRAKPADPWKLEGLDEEAEELDSDEVSTMVNTLDDLKIVGVRPKPKGINADLSVSADVARNPLLFNALRADMANKGFLLFEDQDRNPVLISNEGEVQAGTRDGIVYDLHFGEIFAGSDEEIEVGFATSNSDKQDAEANNTEKKDESGDGQDDGAAQTDENSNDDSATDRKKSRYLYVTARFEPNLLGAAPVKPTEPQRPAGLPEPGASDSGESSSDAPSENSETSEATQPPGENAKEESAATNANDENDDNNANNDGEADNDEEKEQTNPQQAEYESALAKYQDDLKTYDSNVKTHNDKIEKGKKTVDELNARFGEWYYVISAESFDNLRLARKDLVNEKQPSENTEDEAANEDAETEADEPADNGKPADASPETDTPEEKEKAETPSQSSGAFANSPTTRN